MQIIDKIKDELTEGRTFLQFGFFSALGQGLGMITSLIIAKVFLPELMGSYYLAKLVLFFFAVLLISSFTQTPFVVFAGQEREQTGKINKTFSMQCVLYIFSLTVFLFSITFGSRAIAEFAKISSKELFFVILAFFGLGAKTVICDLFLATGQRMKNALVELVFGGFVFICIIILCLTGWVNLRTIFGVYFASGIIIVVVFVKALNFSMLTPILFDRQQFRKYLNFVLWIALGATAAYFIGWGDSIVLRFLTSMSDIGTYNVGYDIYRSILMLVFIIYVYFLPFVSQYINSKEKIYEYLWRKRPRIFFLGFTAIVLIFIFTPFAFRIVYKEVYEGSVTVVRILLIASVFALYNIFYEAIFNSLKKYRVTQTVNVLHVLLNLLLDILLVPKMGINGAAVAAVISYAVRVIVYETYFRIIIKPSLNLSR